LTVNWSVGDYYLTGQVNPVSCGLMEPTGQWYPSGSIVTCQAYPYQGSQFSDWSGDLNGNGNPTTLLIDSPKTIIANFNILNPNPFQINGYCFYSPSQ